MTCTFFISKTHFTEEIKVEMIEPSLTVLHIKKYSAPILSLFKRVKENNDYGGINQYKNM